MPRNENPVRRWWTRDKVRGVDSTTVIVIEDGRDGIRIATVSDPFPAPEPLVA